MKNSNKTIKVPTKILPLNHKAHLHSVYEYYLELINQLQGTLLLYKTLPTEQKPKYVVLAVEDHISNLSNKNQKILHAFSETSSPDLLTTAIFKLGDSSLGIVKFFFNLSPNIDLWSKFKSLVQKKDCSYELLIPNWIYIIDELNAQTYVKENNEYLIPIKVMVGYETELIQLPISHND